jgi:hypothetical protein
VKNVLIHLGHISAEEGWQAMQHLVEDCAQAPPVHSSVVRLFTKDLRSQVLRGTTEGGCGLLRLYTFLTKPKVCQNHMSLRVRDERVGEPRVVSAQGSSTMTYRAANPLTEGCKLRK